MAKKIVISFTGQPTIGDGFIYSILIDSINLVYTNGQTSLNIDYGVADFAPNVVKLEDTLSETIDKTLAFLIANWVSPTISYKRVDDTIEVLVNSDSTVISTGATDVNINLTIADVSDEELLKLRYFLQYTNNVNDTFLCEIYKKNYTGIATEIHGSATLEKGSVKDHLDSIRGTGLSLELEASLDVTLEDLYTQNEQDFVVKFYKNTNILFRGFLKPDGVFQSFVRDIWVISLDCVDGLGALSNLSFVQPSGFRFIGKMKASDIVYNCLKRTGILLPINTSINTLYDGLTYTDNLDILTKIQLNADRFFKNDGQSTGDGTLMSCEEVLKSVLDIFCACITQENGEWYIFKPNEIYTNPYVLFRRYDINNTYIGNVTINVNKSIGSQVDNYYPHHCSGNQKIDIKGSISAFRLGYKYGFVSGLLVNNLLLHDENYNYSGWIKSPFANSFLVNEPLNTSGLFMRSLDISDITQLILTSSPIAIKEGGLFDFKASLTTYGFSTDYLFKIRLGIYTLLSNGEWVTTDSFFQYTLGSSAEDAKNFPEISDTLSVSSRPAPIEGVMYIEIYRPKNRLPAFATSLRPMVRIRSVDITTNSAEFEAKKGEFHTVSRLNKVSSIVKENKSVSNGDRSENFYLGTIFKEDGVLDTQTWSRKGSFESYPLLRIAAEEELRIGQKPLKQFTGSIFGYLPYLSFIAINNLNGKFFPVEYSYDTKANIVDFKLLELYSAEIPDIMYKFTFDYGNTVKPTIIG
jgi:hypothetical protein